MFVQLFRRFLMAFLLLCLGCAAQANSPEVNQRIERQIRAIFGERIPPSVRITVGARTPSTDFPGYDKISVTLAQGERKQEVDFLLSKDSSTLVRVTKFDLTKDPFAEMMKKIDVNGRPVRGNKDAKVAIVNFDDFQCPFCSRMHSELTEQVLKTYGDRVKIVYKDFPLTDIHPWAVHAAVNANCLASQNGDAYWEFADYAHASQKQITGTAQKPPFKEQFAALDQAAIEIGQRRNLQLTPLQSCIKAQSDTAVLASIKEGMELGVSATPTIFVNGEKVDGAVPVAELQAMIDRALRDAGQPVPQSAAAGSAPPDHAPPVSK
jgi:protein-disulfide isomerase